jgi:hypothetical protein
MVWKDKEYEREYKHNYYVQYYQEHKEEMKANSQRRYDALHLTPEYRAKKNAYMEVYNKKRRLYDMIAILYLKLRTNPVSVLDMTPEERREEMKAFILSVIGSKDVAKCVRVL